MGMTPELERKTLHVTASRMCSSLNSQNKNQGGRLQWNRIGLTSSNKLINYGLDIVGTH